MLRDEAECLERADRLLNEGVKGDRSLIASMIMEALQHERAACARVADNIVETAGYTGERRWYAYGISLDISRAILAR